MSLPPAFHESLPYIDPKPTPEALAAARALITAEQAANPPSTNTSVSAPREAKFTPAMTTELDRVASQTPLTTLSLSRYEAQETPPEDATPQRLLEVLENSYVSDAYLAQRRGNLQLLDKGGRNAWLMGNYYLEDELRRLEQELAETKREMDAVNYERQAAQQAVAGEMKLLDETWKKGVGRVLETELAVEDLREQIRQEMRKRAG